MTLEVSYTYDDRGGANEQKVSIPLITGHILYEYHAEVTNKSNNIETIIRNYLGLAKSDYLVIWRVYIKE